MVVKIALYAGFFDPPTNGHWEAIVYSAEIFDKLIVAIADTQQKPCTFPFDDRIRLVKQMISELKEFLVEKKSNVDIQVVSYQDRYLVDIAKQYQVDVLVRRAKGPRDFMVEQQNAKIVREMGFNGVSILILPSQQTENITSSFVKNLVGYTSWREKIKPYVGQKTLNYLTEWCWKKEWARICSECDVPSRFIEHEGERLLDLFGDNRSMCVDTLLDGLEILKICEIEVLKPQMFELSYMYHLAGSSIDQAVKEFANFLKHAGRLHDYGWLQYGTELIRTCDYFAADAEKPKTHSEKLFRDLTLLPVATPFGHWDGAYYTVERACNSYLNEKGSPPERTEAIKSMIQMTSIYKNEWMLDHYELRAKRNLVKELDWITGQTSTIQDEVP